MIRRSGPGCRGRRGRIPNSTSDSVLTVAAVTRAGVRVRRDSKLGRSGRARRDPDQLGVKSDSLNISPRARWVVCPLGRTRGTTGG